MTNKKNPQLSTTTAAKEQKKVSTDTITQNNAYYKLDDIDNERYYMLSKALFTEKYKDLSLTAKNVYAVLKDRMHLSRKRRWIEDDGRIFLFFKQSDIADALQISERTCSRAMNELVKYHLIDVKRQGLGLANKIYILKLASDLDTTNCRVRTDKMADQEQTKWRRSNNEYSNNERVITKKGGSSGRSSSDDSLAAVLKAFRETFNRNANNAETALLKALKNNYSEDFVLHALNETALQHASSLKYTAAILKRWSEMHSLTPWLTDEKEKRKKEKQAQKSNTTTTSGIDAVNKLLEEFS